ncbi:Zn-dependent peptidase ImmA, M78 family [Streptomyces sp. DvalAA-14]|uniref:helix-turn-helix domain-containing protein n=1 Tax=unclassified Streptomyces TaxID=2593676 RepID=UPI00081AFAAB|nr:MULTISPECIES: XRE family transcriptional regulator [unclassified Streptomyces]MYS20488.1 ImmA/IrrE family metallo-endopeptidase [Streptomyces sp. SID4948]SCD70128.1 Zn-dependent peptidase ImmA, M78 family [Streptomyces sp. DvalAA-14]
MTTASRLVLARRRRGLTVTRLAQHTGLTARRLSDFESGRATPSPPSLAALSAALEFPESFFSAGEVADLTADSVSFRALSKMTASQRDIALSSGRLARELQAWIADRFRLPPPEIPSLTSFSRLDADGEQVPSTGESAGESCPAEDAAELVRARWGLGYAPIPHLTHLLEAHGTRVFSLSGDCLEVDAFSFWDRGIPFVLLNLGKTAERGRFDAAHELGHLVLHGEEQMPHGPLAEAEAHRFAAAFLMPRADVLAHAPQGATTDWILQAKRRWKVAAMALAHRLHELALTTEWQYRTHCVDLGRLGYRKDEPRSPLTRETSQVLGKVFAALRREGVRPADVARDLHLRPADLNDLIFGLVVTSQEGGGRGGFDKAPPSLSLVR